MFWLEIELQQEGHCNDHALENHDQKSGQTKGPKGKMGAQGGRRTCHELHHLMRHAPILGASGVAIAQITALQEERFAFQSSEFFGWMRAPMGFKQDSGL